MAYLKVLKAIFGFSVVALTIWPVKVIGEEGTLKVVTTLSTFEALAKEVGGEKVEVKNLASPRFNAHFITPKPTDVLKVRQADLFIHGGLDLEAWRDPLLNAVGRAEFKANGERQLDLSLGIPLLQIPSPTATRAEGDLHVHGNPHFWTSPRNALLIIDAIAAKFAQLVPLDQDYFRDNAARAKSGIESSLSEQLERFKPFQGREAIAYHNQWIYLTDALGLKLERYLEPNPGISPTPRYLTEIKNYISKNSVSGIIQASFYPTSAAELVGRATSIKHVVLCQNVYELPPCSSYVESFKYNAQKLLDLFQATASH